MAGSFISSHTRLSVFCTYFAPWMPVSLLKYLSVGQPPWPAWCFCMSSLDSLQLTSANATLSLGGNLSYTAFQPGCCFIHQPHPVRKNRMNTVLPASISP
eukprot:Tamp_29236.p2 GENE.Tamp_29236~~Tamp_29236.p2  ORF type:complete len:100 (+),score=4.45 Tamp_29236:329-628(+)